MGIQYTSPIILGIRKNLPGARVSARVDSIESPLHHEENEKIQDKMMKELEIRDRGLLDRM